jgi:hypothetical protein
VKLIDEVLNFATSSTHRRFVEALRAGLQLKDQFPEHDIKVSVVRTGHSTEEIKQGTVLH